MSYKISNVQKNLGKLYVSTTTDCKVRAKFRRNIAIIHVGPVNDSRYIKFNK